MKNVVRLLFLLLCMGTLPVLAVSWMGFDSDTGALVEVSPAEIPAQGATVDIHNIDTDDNTSCLVRRVVMNPRTVELMVSTSDGRERILVMETPQQTQMTSW